MDPSSLCVCFGVEYRLKLWEDEELLNYYYRHVELSCLRPCVSGREASARLKMLVVREAFFSVTRHDPDGI
jgi:hypothetical protein